MPIYEYCCNECGYKFEDFVHIGAEKPKCPECQGEVSQLVSRFSSVIKGSEHRLLDCVVGEDAERRRGILEKRKEKRNKLNQSKGAQDVLAKV